MLRRYAILVDGERVATVGRAQAIELELPAGRHRITATIDWAKGNPVDMEANPEGVYHLEVGSNLGGWRILLAFFYATMWPGQWLYLKVLP
jgi:hypothetical protein